MGIKVKDLAARLNLSPATVSLVLNRKPGISEATRKRIYDTLEELGQTDLLSELQKQSDREKIQFIVFRRKSNASSDTKYFNQVFSDIIEGIDVQAKTQGFSLMINYINEENIADQLAALSENACNGILLLATDMDAAFLRMFKKTRIPMVILDNYYESDDCSCVCMNNEQGVFLAVHHLKSMGHEKIGYIHSIVDVHNFSERYYGFVRAMEKCGLPVDSDTTFSIDSNAERLLEELTDAFRNCKELPTALFADNDILAIHAIKALDSLNLRVPQDISVVGFDNMPLSEMLNPPLTTVDVSKYRLGAIAVRRLCELMHGDAADSIKIEINARLVARNSVRSLLPESAES